MPDQSSCAAAGAGSPRAAADTRPPPGRSGCRRRRRWGTRSRGRALFGGVRIDQGIQAGARDEIAVVYIGLEPRLGRVLQGLERLLELIRPQVAEADGRLDIGAVDPDPLAADVLSPLDHAPA